jgi:diketogulonate reductase-like aldo/keto reductase
MPSTQPKIKLNDGHEMPSFGFGVWQIGNDETARAVGAAIEIGYRLIDTASMYGNEEGVGEAVRNASVPRQELFIATKLWNDSHGFDRAIRSFEASLKRLRLDRLDLFMIHWPAPGQDRYVDTWRALIRLREEGRATSVGVCNFNAAQLQRLADETGVFPAVNQVELHPRFQQAALRAFHAQNGIATEAWAPLGKGRLIEDATLRDIAAKHDKSTAQVILRWHRENGIIAIPKSVNPSRMRENFEAFSFDLDAEDLARIASLDSADGRTGPDPATFPGLSL